MTLSLALSLALAAAAAAPSRQVVDRVAAVVNGDVVTLQELARKAGPAYDQAAALPPGTRRDAAVRDTLQRALDAVIADRLFDAQAKALEINVNDAMVDAQVEDIKRRNGFDDADLDRALAAEGLDRAAFRAQLRTQLQNFELLRLRIGSKVRTSEEDLLNYYQTHLAEFEGEDEVKVRHIFVPLAPGASAADVARAQTYADKILARLRAGEDFAAVAEQVSQGPNAEDGGDLGWIPRGRLDPTLEKTIFGLKEGAISAPVRSGPGLHIFKAEARRKGNARSFEEAKAEIRNRLLDEQGEAYRQQYVAELRRDAVIDVLMPELKP